MPIANHKLKFKINYIDINNLENRVGDYKSLTVYKKAFDQAMNIFEITKKFPEEEKWSLTSQIRRSSRSVCSNLGEGYRKRLYENHFISKISDADMENTETQVWFDFALACKYIKKDKFDELSLHSQEIGRLLNHMIQYPDKYASSNTNKLEKGKLESWK